MHMLCGRIQEAGGSRVRLKKGLHGKAEKHGAGRTFEFEKCVRKTAKSWGIVRPAGLQAHECVNVAF